MSSMEMEIRHVNSKVGSRKVDITMFRALRKLEWHKLCMYFCGMMAIYHLAMNELQIAGSGPGPEHNSIVQPQQLSHNWDQRLFDLREGTEILRGDLHLMEAVTKKSRRISGRKTILSRGAGSSPPQCLSKCGKCTSSCVSVLVPINPRGHRTPMEYYPEVWRCRCGDRLYIP